MPQYNQQKTGKCPLCGREAELSDHHLIPKTRGGTDTEAICHGCHSAVHAFFTNKQLERDYNSVDKLIENERFAKHVKWLSKQNPARTHRVKLAKDQRKRGRNG